MTQADGQVLRAPSGADVLRALQCLEPADVRRAALHLATPRGVALGPHVRLVADVASWRGARVPLEGTSWSAIAYGAAELALAAWAPGDVALDLQGAPATWLKLVRSGATIHLAGARELFDAQQITFDLDVNAAVARLVAQQVCDRQPLTNAMIHLGGQAVRVRASSSAAHVGG